MRAAGRVREVSPQADPTTGTFRVRAEFPNTNNALWPGQFVNVRLTLRTLAEGVVVRGVPGELREAALNLIHNASDAMPEGGVLHVTVAAVEQQVQEHLAKLALAASTPMRPETGDDAGAERVSLARGASRGWRLA